MYVSNSGFFTGLFHRDMLCKISINLFFIIFLLSKANFGIKDYTENIHKIPTPRNREKDYSRILPERQAKETLLEF